MSGYGGAARLAERVRAEAAAWVWVPPDAEDLTTADYRLTLYADRASVQWSRTSRPVDEVVDEVVARAAGRPVLRWWTSAGTRPAYTANTLQDRGFVEVEVVDVLARPLGGAGGAEGLGGTAGAVPDLAVPPDVTVEPADDEDRLRLGADIDAAVFDWGRPTAAQLAEALAVARAGLRGEPWRGRQYLAFLDGRPVGHGGCALVPDVVRLWGGAVLPEARGRGAYRALLEARLRFGAEQGASLALVKGRVATSGPILRRAGFAAYGQERCHQLQLD